MRGPRKICRLSMCRWQPRSLVLLMAQPLEPLAMATLNSFALEWSCAPILQKTLCRRLSLCVHRTESSSRSTASPSNSQEI